MPTTVAIALDGYTDDYSALPLQVEVRSATTGEALLTLNPALSPTGEFSLMLTPATYHLAFKADRSLRKVLTGISLPTGTLPVSLLNGDIDGDNEVTLFDFGILVRNFGQIGDE